MKNLKELLVGAQLVDISNSHITIKIKGKEFVLEIEEDYGDCCGYNEVETKCFYEKGSKRNPVITDIKVDTENEDNGNRCILTFFGEDKMLAEVNSFSSSGSGWFYGACVTIECDVLKLNETLSQW